MWILKRPKSAKSRPTWTCGSSWTSTTSHHASTAMNSNFPESSCPTCNLIAIHNIPEVYRKTGTAGGIKGGGSLESPKRNKARQHCKRSIDGVKGPDRIRIIRSKCRDRWNRDSRFRQRMEHTVTVLEKWHEGGKTAESGNNTCHNHKGCDDMAITSSYANRQTDGRDTVPARQTPNTASLYSNDPHGARRIIPLGSLSARCQSLLKSTPWPSSSSQSLTEWKSSNWNA